MNIRMLTHSKEGAFGAYFTKSNKDSTFGKIFHNMDETSFNADTDKQIELMISNSKTALFLDHDEMINQKEYKNCQVCIQIKVHNSV